jgi:hypothetical protein
VEEKSQEEEEKKIEVRLTV